MTQPVKDPIHTVMRAGFANPLTLDIKVTDPSYVEVFVDDLLLDPDEYTIAGINSDAGVEITILDAADPDWFPDATRITAAFAPPVQQNADLSAGGVFGQAYEDAIDAIVRILLSQKGAVDRTLKVPFGVTGDITLPFPVPGAAIAWDEDGTGFINGPSTADISAISPYLAAIAIVSNIGDDVEAVAANATAVATAAANIAAIIAAPGAASSAASSATAAAAALAAMQLPAVPVALGYLRRNADNTLYEMQTLAQLRSSIAADPWSFKAIGEPFALWDHITGCPVPTNDANRAFIKLSAADAFNAGILTSESVTGSAPLVQATAVVSDAGSPINGRTVRLINTERRALRAGLSGTAEADQLQGFSIAVPFRAAGATFTGGGGGGPPAEVGGTTAVAPTTDGSNGTPRTGTETRSKNIGATFYMRIR